MPRPGKPDPAFGVNGRVDVIDGLPYAERGRNYAINSTPVIVNDVIIAGSNISDVPFSKEAPRGDIFGFDVRTGKKLWTFHSVPQEGEFGHDTWEDGSADYTGNTNVWSMMTVDAALGYVYLPFGTPTNDYYGGHRLGDNLFAESLVCLDASTGKRVWHFQAVHHGLWDYDFPAAPILADITVSGRRIKRRRAGEQARICLRLRPADGHASVADRRASRAAVDGAGRTRSTDAALSDPPARLRPSGPAGR